jgi:hypothetical protein
MLRNILLLVVIFLTSAGSVTAFAQKKSSAQKERSIQKERLILWKSIECDVAWNAGSCTATKDLDAPPGWQACKVVYSLAHEGGFATSKKFTPDNWYTNDPESPDRYRRYKVHISASGSDSIFNQVGARIRLENVGIDIIPATADNAARYAAGCDMPDHD